MNQAILKTNYFDNEPLDEKRRHTRIEVMDTHLLIDMHGTGYVSGRVKDVSHEGLFIIIPNTHWCAFERIELLFNQNNDMQRAEAQVVRITEKGLGLWVNRHEAINQDFVYNYLPKF